MRTSRPPQGASPPTALPALLRATHLFGLALGSALGKLRDSGVTTARMFASGHPRSKLLPTRGSVTSCGRCRAILEASLERN
jgi:hypothetical protein